MRIRTDKTWTNTTFMMTSSNGNIFRITGPLCGEFTGPGEFPAQRPVTRSFDVFFDLRLNKRLNKQSWGWWFETLSRPFWRHRNGKLDPHRVGFGMFQQVCKTNIMATEALAPCVTRCQVAMILPMSFMTNNFNHLCHFSVDELHKM